MKLNKEEQRITNVLKSNIETLVQEYPDQRNLIMECLYQLYYEPQQHHSNHVSDIAIQVYDSVGELEWSRLIKVELGY